MNESGLHGVIALRMLVPGVRWRNKGRDSRRFWKLFREHATPARIEFRFRQRIGF
jgi:hypothetical protein